jgi:hypothetical protein
MTTLVIILAVVATVAVVAWFFLNRQNPEVAASHVQAEKETTSDQLYGGSDRPAGPDVEPMDPDRLGGDHRPPT